MKGLLLGFAGLVAAGGVAAGVYVALPGGGEEEVLQEVATATASPNPEASAATSPSAGVTASPSPAPTAGVGMTLWRWVNVTVLIPADSDVSVTTEGLTPEQKPPNGGLAISIVRDTVPNDGDKLSIVLIDAETGATLVDEVLDEDRAAIDRILETLSVGELDRATAAWPYAGDVPESALRDNSGPYSFIRPPASTGLQVYGGISDPGGEFIGITNGASAATVSYDQTSGILLKSFEHVLPEDKELMERWTQTVLLCGDELAC